MCSVIDFIEKQKLLIEKKRKTIKSLYNFLLLIDGQSAEELDTNVESEEDIHLVETHPKIIETNGTVFHKKSVLRSEIKDSNDLMLNPSEHLNWFTPSNSDQKRKQLSEERRQEYNEYLKQKSRFDSENQKKKTKRVTKVIPDYNDLLCEKRVEEHKHRELNGFDEMETNSVGDSKPEYSVPTVGWFHCSNNKYLPEFITPRSRLLATHSSRLKAIQYREELRKQIEEKNKIKEQEREKIRLEEELLEKKIEAQRLKLLKEYEEELRLRKKTDEIKLREERDELVPKRDQTLINSMQTPLSVLRSPTYMPFKEMRTSSPKKTSKVSRSLSSALNETMRATHSAATQTSAAKKSNISSGELSDRESSPDEEEPQNTSPKEFRKRVLSQLSEVRQMMESDHIRMMEELRHQQQMQE